MIRDRLTDEQWECISDLFPARAKTGRPPTDRRLIVDGILWILRTGAAWRNLTRSSVPGKPSTVVSIDGMTMARWTRFSSDCVRLMLTWGPSTKICGASMGRSFELTAAPLAAEKKRPGGTNRSRFRPFSRGIFDENPSSLRCKWPPTSFPPDARPGTRIDGLGRIAQWSRRERIRQQRRTDCLAGRNCR